MYLNFCLLVIRIHALTGTLSNFGVLSERGKISKKAGIERA
jgi:hypothetical protein